MYYNIAQTQEVTKMAYDKKQVADKLVRWDRYIKELHLPRYDELPSLELYMDQVIVLLNQYLRHFVFAASEDKLITPSMVNNYVKMKLLPAPMKKKYGRTHLACLIMICTLKQTLSISVIKRMLPVGDEAEVCRQYDEFVSTHQRLSNLFAQQVMDASEEIFNLSFDRGNEVANLAMSAGLASAFGRLLTEKIVALQLPDDAPENS